MKDGAVLLQKGYGYADIAGKVAMDSRHTIVGVGSVSKLFTWTAVMQLVEQGKLDLAAGYIVERLSGARFETYSAEHILRPLGMDHSAFCKPLPISMRANLAKSYHLASSGEVLPPTANIRDPRCSPAGDLASTADDISHFMLAHLQDGQYEGLQILRPESADQMHATTFTPLPGALGSTLGFFRNDMNGYRVIAHDGDLSGFHSDRNRSSGTYFRVVAFLRMRYASDHSPGKGRASAERELRMA